MAASRILCYHEIYIYIFIHIDKSIDRSIDIDIDIGIDIGISIDIDVDIENMYGRLFIHGPQLDTKYIHSPRFLGNLAYTH